MVSSYSKFESIGRTNFSTAETISTIEVFNYLLAEIPRYLQIFCHIHSVKIGANFGINICFWATELDIDLSYSITIPAR